MRRCSNLSTRGSACWGRENWALTSSSGPGILRAMRNSTFDRVSVAELIRPANATAYGANQIIGAALPTPLVFLQAGRSANASGYVRSVRVLTNQSSCVAVLTLWLYNVPTFSAQADQATFQNLWLERKMCVGSILMPALQQYGSSDYALAESWFESSEKIFQCGSVNNNLYGQLTTGTIFTPASGQIFRVELGCNQNEYQ